MTTPQSHDSLRGLAASSPNALLGLEALLSGWQDRAGHELFSARKALRCGTPPSWRRKRSGRDLPVIASVAMKLSILRNRWLVLFRRFAFQLLSFRNQRCPSEECLGKVEVTECPRRKRCFPLRNISFRSVSAPRLWCPNGGNYQVTFADNAVIALPDFVDERSALRCDSVPY